MKKYTVEEIREILENEPKEFENYEKKLKGAKINKMFVYYEDFFIETNTVEAIIFYTNGEPSAYISIKDIKEIY